MDQISGYIGKAILVLVGVALIAIVMAIPVWWLWNNFLVGAVDGVNQIGLLQSLGLNILFGMLFRSTNRNITSSIKDSLDEK
jgi:hypothetical protein